MAAPHVTVLVPTYNHGAFLQDTLDSILAQDHESFDVVVSDDGSTDSTIEIARTYAERHPDRVRVLTVEHNTGIAANFTRCVEAVRGELYAWCAGDDVMLPGKLSRQVALMQRRPDAVVTVHDAEVFDSDSGTVLGRFGEMYNGRREYLEGGVELLLRPGYVTLPSTMMIRTEARPRHGYDERLRFSNEWVYDVETFSRGRCVPLNEVLLRYRRHGGNVTASPEAAHLGSEENLVALALIQARFPELTRLVRRRRTAMFVANALAARAQGDRAQALALLRAARADGGLVDVARSLLALARVRLGRARLGAATPR
jgi:glycosyltransferase involved in cell wall biosynthesis